ncbi:MAG: toll/interleukin-1 receptor domain-containing protein [Vicinamibacterales bacterium]
MPKAFLSYSQQDKDTANKLAADLQRHGVDTWFDLWEIGAGDSLIQRIFVEGLANASFFLVLLSPNSVKSRWVREELDAALIRRLEGVLKVIPVVLEPTSIPVPLRTLRWVNLADNYDTGLREIVKTLHGVSEKPPVGQPPEFVRRLRQSVGGLSPEASTLGSALVRLRDDSAGLERYFPAKEVHDLASFMSAEDVNDAVEELESYGLVKLIQTMGTAPYDFSDLEPTYALYLHFREELDHNPDDDLCAVANAIAGKNELSGPTLQEIVQLPPGRLNRAVAYLDAYGHVRVLRAFGTAPFDFLEVMATSATRRFVREHCSG